MRVVSGNASFCSANIEILHARQLRNKVSGNPCKNLFIPQLKMLKLGQNCNKLSCGHKTFVFLMNIFIAESCMIECSSFEDIWINAEGETAFIRNSKKTTKELSTLRLKLPQMSWSFTFIFFRSWKMLHFKIRLILESQFSLKTMLTNCYNLRLFVTVVLQLFTLVTLTRHNCWWKHLVKTSFGKMKIISWTQSCLFCDAYEHLIKF